MQALRINEVLHGDCKLHTKDMPDCCIDLVVTSPPYDKLRTYSGYDFDFEGVAMELSRIIKIGGVIVWVVADSTVNGREALTSAKQKIFFVEQCGLWLHDTMIYAKRNFSHPETTRYHNVFEYMFIFSKGKPKTFNPIMDRKNITAGQVGNLGVNTFTLKDGSKSVRSKKLTNEYGMRHNVWLGNTRGQEDMCISLQHPAMMPKWLAADHIKTWSNEGGLIYDPFCGSGTTCIEAKRLGRSYIGSDISAEYVDLARRLINP